jgi:ferredoxin
VKVKFVPQNVEFEIKPGESVLHVAQDHGIYVKSVCKGVPACAECRCRVIEGEHNVLPPTSEEVSLIGTGHFIDHRRLSCQLKCFGDITVDLSEQIAKQQALTQKSKSSIVKDDRVEDARAIRSSHYDDEAEGADASETSQAEPVSAAETEAQQRKPEKHQERQMRQGHKNQKPSGGAKHNSSGPGQAHGGGGKKRRRRGGGGKGGPGGGSGSEPGGNRR